MTDIVALKAPESSCKGCGAAIPAQRSGPGRPRKFCTRWCRRRYHHDLEQADIERERAEEKERAQRALDERFHGKRAAARMAREREERRAYWARQHG